MTRRSFLGTSAVAMTGKLPLARAETEDPGKQLAAILARIKDPKFPERNFEITQYGARDGGKAARHRGDPQSHRGVLGGRRRPGDRSGRLIPHRGDSFEEPRQPAPGGRGYAVV